MDRTGSSISTKGRGLYIIGRADGLTDIDVLDAGDGNDIAHRCLFQRYTVQILEGIEACQMHACGGSVLAADHSLVAGLQVPAVNSADGNSSGIAVIINIGDQKLRDLRWRHPWERESFSESYQTEELDPFPLYWDPERPQPSLAEA